MYQFLKRNLKTIWLIQLALLPVSLWATFAVQNIFNSGETISSSQMNTNFDEIEARLNLIPFRVGKGTSDSAVTFSATTGSTDITSLTDVETDSSFLSESSGVYTVLSGGDGDYQIVFGGSGTEVGGTTSILDLQLHVNGSSLGTVGITNTNGSNAVYKSLTSGDQIKLVCNYSATSAGNATCTAGAFLRILFIN